MESLEFDKQRKHKVAFGATGDREIFPTPPHTKCGAELSPLKGTPNIGPGKYEHDEKTSLYYHAKNFLSSTKGYVIGARSGPRIRQQFTEKTPPPHQYQKVLAAIEPTEPDAKPFNVGARQYKPPFDSKAPGPGMYEHDIQKKHVNWHQAFGGKPTDLPSATLQSTVSRNTDKLPSSKDEMKYQRRLAYLKLYW